MTNRLPEKTPQAHGEPPVRPHPAQQLRRQIGVDAAIRWVSAAAVVVCLGLAITAAPSNATGLTVLAIVALAVWLLIGTANTRVTQQLPQLTALIDKNPATSETPLLAAIGRKALTKSLRLGLYHRLAIIRQRQQQHHQVMMICQAVLGEISRSYPVRRLATGEPSGVGLDPVSPISIEQMYRRVLFMLVDASLHCRMLTEAYWALTLLHQCKLGLIDLLQLLWLQTRYEIAAGHQANSLYRIDQKVALAEIMPATQCGSMHVLLAVAADRCGHSELGLWLRSRAELLCRPDQTRCLDDGQQYAEP